MDQVYSIKDVGPYDLWTTVLVRPDLDPKRPLRGFHYSIGANIPGTPLGRKVPACRAETNMRGGGVLFDDTFDIDGVEWRVPILALGKYQDNGLDYHVTREDVVEFLRQVVLILRVSAEGAERRLVLISDNYVGNGPFCSDLQPDAVGSYGVAIPLRQNAFHLNRLEHFWIEVGFPSGAPKLGGVLPLFVALSGQRTRGVA